MFAIIETSGTQYKVEKGSILEINQISAKEGDTFTFDKVLLVSDKTATKVGTPLVSGAFVTAKVVEHKKGEKIIVFKMKAKKRYKKTQGHRQRLTKIEITDIKASGADKSATVEAKAKKTPVAKAKKATTKASE